MINCFDRLGSRKRRGLTRADRRARKAPDLLKRDFAPPPAVNQRWVSDLTEIPTGEGTLYLASILDLNSRRCVGYALGVHHDADLAAAALCVAIAVRGGDVAGVVFHTDSEYVGAGVPGLPDPHSDGRFRMSVLGCSRAS